MTATATLSDGTTKDVTADAAWISLQTSVVTVEGAGTLKAAALGRATLRVGYGQFRDDVPIEVMPLDTFVLEGHVNEVAAGPLTGATLEIIEGSPAGQSVRTDSEGYFAIFGLSGTLRVRATSAGYVPLERNVSMTSDQELNFELTSAVQPIDVSGMYQLTVLASNSCKPSYNGILPLPVAARRRTYSASINQDNAQVNVTLSGADFIPFPRDPVTHSGSGFSGHISGSDSQVITFTIDGDPEGPYDLLERLSPTVYLGIGGTLVAAIGANRLEGNLDGIITAYGGTGDFYTTGRTVITGNCEANTHAFIFERLPSAARAHHR